MCDEMYYYRDRCQELERINEFVRVNTLRKVLNSVEYIRDEREKSGLPTYGITMCIEVVRSMLKSG